MPRVALVVAVDEAGTIGRDGALPWRLPSDLRHFKQITMGKPVVMGRKTFESIGRPLPGRENIVLSRDPDYRAEGCRAVGSLPEALAAAGEAEELMVIGGAELYAQALPLAERIYLTRVHARLAGDTFMSRLDPEEWLETRREAHPADARNPYAHTFVVLERRRPAR